MFRRSVCSLLLLMLVSGVAVESAQAESSPTTPRTHGRHVHGHKPSQACQRRTLTHARHARCHLGQRHRARTNAKSRRPVEAESQLPPPIADPPGLPRGHWQRFKCDQRYLHAAKRDGATHTRRFKQCKAKLQRRTAPNIHARGYWATYLTTAYCQTGYTASGSWTSWGTVAATLPFGSRLYIPGYGDGTVLDRGGAVGPGHVDLYMPSCQEAIDWGARTERIEIFTN